MVHERTFKAELAHKNIKQLQDFVFLQQTTMAMTSSSSNDIEKISDTAMTSQSTEDSEQLKEPPFCDVPIASTVQGRSSAVTPQEKTVNDAPANFTGAPMGTSLMPESSSAPQTTMGSYSIKAIVSLIFAILGLFLLGIILGPIAMCLGFRALSEIKEQRDSVKGKCMAASGVVIGLIGFIGSVVFIIIRVQTASANTDTY
jgi:Domain of unknown function (DUF4190)